MLFYISKIIESEIKANFIGKLFAYSQPAIGPISLSVSVSVCVYTHVYIYKAILNNILII